MIIDCQTNEFLACAFVATLLSAHFGTGEAYLVLIVGLAMWALGCCITFGITLVEKEDDGDPYS